MAILMCLAGVSANSQIRYEVVEDPKTIAAVVANTAAAAAQEILYKNYNDTILMRSSMILASSLVKLEMKNLDMNARKDFTALDKANETYIMLVDETTRLTAAVTDFLKNARKYPHGTFECYKSITMLVMEAKALVKEAVVVGFGGKVPNPFKVDLKKLLTGQDNTPSYNNTPGDKDSNGKKASDGDNLLLLDERLQIINHTIERIRQLRLATVAATWKLKTYYGWRNQLWNAKSYRNTKNRNIEMAVRTVQDDLKNIPGWRW